MMSDFARNYRAGGSSCPGSASGRGLESKLQHETTVLVLGKKRHSHMMHLARLVVRIYTVLENGI